VAFAVFTSLTPHRHPQSQKMAMPFSGSARPPPQNTCENLTVSKKKQGTLAQLKTSSAETSKKQSKGKPGVQENKFFNKNLHLRTSGSIFIKKFAPLTVSGLAGCFVFRGFFAKKKCCFFSFN
jgi:hypothetical protein